MKTNVFRGDKIIIKRFVKLTDYYDHSGNNIEITIHEAANHAYRSAVCSEFRKTGRKINPSLRKYLKKCVGLTFFYDETNSASIYINSSVGKRDAEELLMICYHEISHAFNRKRFQPVTDMRNDILLEGQYYIDEFLAHYDSNYCVMKEFRRTFGDQQFYIEEMIKVVYESEFSPYLICELLSLLLIYVTDENSCRVKTVYPEFFEKLMEFAGSVRYLITKEQITSEDYKEFIRQLDNAME